jgi:hypothetical protein
MTGPVRTSSVSGCPVSRKDKNVVADDILNNQSLKKIPQIDYFCIGKVFFQETFPRSQKLLLLFQFSSQLQKMSSYSPFFLVL